MTVLRCAMLWSLALALMGSVMAQTLQTFTIKDYLRHQWTDEIVQFPIAYRGELPPTLTLTVVSWT